MATLPKSRKAHPEASVNRQGMPPRALLRITGQDAKKTLHNQKAMQGCRCKMS